MDSLVKYIRIADKTIGYNKPIFIVAEAGINHNGSLKNAKKLVDIALESGADAVKFQTYKAENVVTSNLELLEYQRDDISKNIKQIDIIKKYELKYEDFKKIKKYCDNKNIIFLSTPHSFDAIDFLEELVPAYKIGSGDLTNISFLRHVARKNKPVILGTGMATLKEVKKAVEIIKCEKNYKIIVLHCTTNYPTKFEEVNLRMMITMQKHLKCLVGYSDHTLGITVPIAAAALGARVIEKHFTIDKKLSGPDHKASLEPDELAKMIREIRNTEKILGKSEKKPTKTEKKIMKFVRKSIVASQDIDRGAIITKEMITIKRPATGIPPTDFDKIIGKRAKNKILKDQIIKKSMLG
jgi:N-acetylneuraminate synthase/N,N'-diacetyllegionaminate synthase